MPKQGNPLTIADAAKLIAAKKLSPVELVDECLKKVASLDATLNAFITVTGDAARAAARTAETEIAAGRYRGPLHGIPIGIKDIYETAGLSTTGHSRVCEDYVPKADATTVRLMAEAGSISLGKLSTWEFATGGPSFDLPWPPARNPWNPRHDPGGSSSGTGAAVASGMVLGGLGSDTGGSIRYPAAMSGIAGIKPTYGRVSRAGVIPLSFSLDHTGPMAWTSEDCALMLQVLAGYDPLDPASADTPVPDYTAALTGDLKGMKIGVLRQFYEKDNPADGEVITAIEESIAVLKDLGAEIREMPELPPMFDFTAASTVIIRGEAYAIHEETMQKAPELYGALCRERIMMGGLLTAVDYVQALRRRRELVSALATAMADVDLVILPTVPNPADEIEDINRFTLFKRPFYTGPFNLTGSPAMSVCNGFSASGLPLSLQIVGHPFQEAAVLRAGDAFEKATAWRGYVPDTERYAA